MAGREALHELERVRRERVVTVPGSPLLIHGTLLYFNFHWHWPRLACCHRCHGGRSHTQGREVLHELELVRRKRAVTVPDLRLCGTWMA